MIYVFNICTFYTLEKNHGSVVDSLNGLLENLTKESRKGWILQESVEGVRRNHQLPIIHTCPSILLPHPSSHSFSLSFSTFSVSLSLSLLLPLLLPLLLFPSFSQSFLLYPSPPLILNSHSKLDISPYLFSKISPQSLCEKLHGYYRYNITRTVAKMKWNSVHFFVAITDLSLL